MAFPTIFRIFADLVGIGAGALSSQPRITSLQSEQFESNTFSVKYGSRVFAMDYKKKERLVKMYYKMIAETGLEKTNRPECMHLQRQVIRDNFFYLHDYFKRKYPHLITETPYDDEETE